MQSRNKETIHRRSQSSRCSHRNLRPHRGEVHGKRADPRLTKRLIFRDSVNKNNYDTLITALILAGLVFWLMASTTAAPHRWSPETSGSQIWPRPALMWGDDDSISPPKKKCPVQLPRVFTAAPHQTFIKCHLYSVWCGAISISQAVKWCLKQLLAGSVKKKTVQILT